MYHQRNLRNNMYHERNLGNTGMGYLIVFAWIIVLVIISAFIVSLVWGWIIPQVFPSAVEQGIIPASITIIQAFKLSILFSFLGLSGKSTSKKNTYNSFGEFLTVFLIALPIWALVVALSGLLISLVWGWVVPDIFSGMVAHNIIPATLPFWHAVLLSFLLRILGLSGHHTSTNSKD
jgi:hypothetical protein